MKFAEQVITVGNPHSLAGVVTTPSARNDDRTVIILNSGLMHHVGTCNLSVKIARRLAELGTLACRFDLSNIGDSPGRRFDGSHVEREISEITEMIDYLQREFDSSRFLLVGLCSGADAALATAAVDERVIGIAQIDPLCFRTRRWYLYHGYRKLTNPDVYRRLWRRIRRQQIWFDGLKQQFLFDLGDQSRPNYQLSWLAKAYQQFIKRSGRLFVGMTNGQSGCYNYRGQFAEVFSTVDFEGNLEEHYFPHTGHIISEPNGQAAMTNRITTWCQHDSVS